MREKHSGTQPLWNAFQTRANELFGGPSVGSGKRYLERVGVIASLGLYDRSAVYDNHFRPTPFSIRGYTIRCRNGVIAAM
jgi:hypothetical protein